MINQLIKEVCEGCSKSVSIGQAITECFNCSNISHTKLSVSKNLNSRL